MKKGLIILVAILVILLLFYGFVYNNLVSKDEKINQEQAEIDNQLKRRADLIPNLVSTVKGLSKQEQALVDSVTAARSKMTTGNMEDRLAANDNLSTSINILVENYPVLKSDSAYTGLMDELAGTENRIANARRNYNNEVGSFNTLTKTFPTNVVASMSGFKVKPYLETSDEDKINPEVNF